MRHGGDGSQITSSRVVIFDASTTGGLASRLREKIVDQLCEHNATRQVLDEVFRGADDVLLAPAVSVRSSTVALGVLGNRILDI